MALDIVWLTPRDGLVAAAVVVPLGALALARLRAARVRRRVGLTGSSRRRELLAVPAILGVAALLGVAAAQPVLEHRSELLVRNDAQALFVVDTSRSMLASSSPSAPTRLAQARLAAQSVRGGLASIPSGVASLTDRLVPHLFPSRDQRTFDAVVLRALAIDTPPPRDENPVATTFGALAGIPRANYFAPRAHRRVVVLVTDAESRPFDAGRLRDALRRGDGTGLVVLPLGTGSDRIWGRDGTAEPDFRPEPTAAALRNLGGAGARVVHDASGAAAAAAQPARPGPDVARRQHDRPNAPGPLRRRRGLPAAGRTPARPEVSVSTHVSCGTMRHRRTRTRRLAVVLAGLAVTALAAGSSTGAAAEGDTGWTSFGGSFENTRHSPLEAITVDTVKNLQPAWKIDFAKLDPTIRLGQQGYPLVIGKTMYATTANDVVYALDAATGTVRWSWRPLNRGMFRNFGIQANRGVTYCNGRIFLATLDMRLVMFDAGTGKVLRNVPIADAVPGATAQQGYSETSPPLCYRDTLLVGAAGADYGVRSFFVGYKAADLTPAWPHPYWIIPPELQGWRSKSRLVGGGGNWTPSTVDPTTGTVYFDTGAPAPIFYPQLRPGNNPRTDSLIALDVRTGKQRWWQQQLADDQWGYDTAQPPMVYDAKVGGKTQRIVSVGSKEGVWFAYDAKSGKPIYQRVKVVDQIEHPALQAGRPVTVFPASLGGLNYSPASYDPQTNYVLNAASEIASTLVQTVLTPKQQNAARAKGDVFLGLDNGNFGSAAPGLQGSRQHQRDRRRHRAARVEVRHAGARARRHHHDRRRRRLRGRRRRRVPRLRDEDRQGAVDVQHRKTHRRRSSVYAVDGVQYVAITVGGTPTSSNGGTASQVFAFTLGGKTAAGTPGKLGATASGFQPPVVGTPAVPQAQRATFSTPVTETRPWRDDAENYDDLAGTLRLRGQPVQGAQVLVDGYVVPQKTDSRGPLPGRDRRHVAARHPVRVVSAAGARAGGKALGAADRKAVLAASGGVRRRVPGRAP